MKNYDYFIILINTKAPNENFVKRVSLLANKMLPYKIIFLILDLNDSSNTTDSTTKKIRHLKRMKVIDQVLTMNFDNLNHFDVSYNSLKEINLKKYIKPILNEPVLVLFDGESMEQTDTLSAIYNQTATFPNISVYNISKEQQFTLQSDISNKNFINKTN